MTTPLTIFVCGTQNDLSDERSAVLNAIRRLQLQHDSMEFFGARPNRPIETCLSEVRRSDALIVIVGHSYGTLVPELGISYSEAEYNEGNRLKKPCLVYFRDENVPILPKYIERDPVKIALLEKFKQTLSGRHTIARFQNATDLSVAVAADLSRIVQELKAKAEATVGYHINKLREGIASWNGWRVSNPKSAPDFRGADLSGTNLSYADFHEADLSGANLSNAVLLGTNFSAAKLIKADFTSALIGDTIFNNTDLASTIGLETVQHSGQSSIGIDTIYLSKGNIPGMFLRSAGVPENFITFMHSLMGKAFEFYSCFISYSDKDRAFAKRLHADLQANGIRAWFAPEDLKIGDKFELRIDEAIRVYDRLLVILSAKSVESAWVEHEVRTALNREKEQKRTVLFPIRLDSAVMETTQQWADGIRRTRHIGDFTQWKDHEHYQMAFARLLRDLRADQIQREVLPDRTSGGRPKRSRAK